MEQDGAMPIALTLPTAGGTLVPPAMPDALCLSFDLGTGSARAALLGRDGRVRRVEAVAYEQIVPRFGWAEQHASRWWDATATAIRALLAAEPDARDAIEIVCGCGQMHGTVLLDERGEPTRDVVPLWNDKRTEALVAAYEHAHPPGSDFAESGNPPTSAWPGFKLAWLRDNDPAAYAGATQVVMPKDWINRRLCGRIAMDEGDASCSFLMHPSRRAWSSAMVARLGLDGAKLPPIRPPLDILGAVTPEAATATGLRVGTPVMVGAADFAAALLGSGVFRPGLASDTTGTSCIITLNADAPIDDPAICNLATIDGGWASFVLLESGGDAVRWARRALHGGRLDYAAMAASAATAPAGSDGLLFLPYLTGERLGRRRNSRAQFFGLSAAHDTASLDRALLEGVAFAANRSLRLMSAHAGGGIERVIASGGGARNALWLRIKASAYDIPIAVPEEPECGLVGCAVMAAVATGQAGSLPDAVARCVRHGPDILPEAAWAERYARMQPIFDQLHETGDVLFDALDALDAVDAPRR